MTSVDGRSGSTLYASMSTDSHADCVGLDHVRFPLVHGDITGPTWIALTTVALIGLACRGWAQSENQPH